MNQQLDSRLAAVFDEIVRHAPALGDTPSDELLVPAAPDAPRRMLLAVACAAIVATSVVGIAVFGTGPRRAPTTPAATTTLAFDPAWEDFEAPPLTPRFQFLSVGTGDGWFVWGGYESDETSPVLVHMPFDGAYYATATASWRLLPDAPFVSLEAPEYASRQRATWTGDEVVVVQVDDAVEIAAFDPDAFSWRPIAVPDDIAAAWPTQSYGPTLPAVEWIDGHVVLIFPNDAELMTPPSVIRWDPAADRWTIGTAPVIDPNVAGGTVLASSDQLFVVGGAIRHSDSSCSGSSAIHVYTVATDTWTRFPLDDVTWEPAIVAWTGDRLLLAGGWRCLGSRQAHEPMDAAMLLDPVTGQWTATTPLPVAMSEAGRAVVVDGWIVAARGDFPNTATNAVVGYDIVDARWTEAPPLLESGVTAGEILVTALGDRIAIWSPGLYGPTDDVGNTACCFPDGRACTIGWSPTFDASDTSPATTSPPSTTTTAVLPPPPGWCEHVVTSGESPRLVAEQYGIAYDDLAHANPGLPNDFYEGARLHVPCRANPAGE